LNVEYLMLLKNEAEKLSQVQLFELNSSMDDRILEHFFFWLQRPLVHLKSILEELALTQKKDLDVHLYSCVELKRILNEASPDDGCKKIIDQWHNQAGLIVQLAERLIDEMDFSFLYQEERGLFSIGYNLDIAQFDKSTYDLLASEARIASYIAIAKGDVPVEHWFRLSRRLTRINQDEILLSWGGTMFEYLMPLLFLRSFDDTMMNNTCQNVIKWQKK